MKNLIPVVVLTLGSGLVAFATTTDQLELISGSSTVTISDNGGGDSNPANGTIAYSTGNFNGWEIDIATGTSHSPGLTPFGLDVASLTATCNGGGCATQSLSIVESDINFNVPVGVNGFTTTFSTTQTGGGSATESAYFSNLNTIFGTSNLIGTVGPFTSSGVGSASGGSIAAVPNYSLTLEQTFTDASGAGVSFSADGNLTSPVPEPAAISLLGGILLVLGSRLRKRLA